MPSPTTQDQTRSSSTEGFGFYVVLLALAKHFWPIVLVPIAAALLTLSFVQKIPKIYTSVAHLAIKDDEARAIVNYLTTPATLDELLAKFPQEGETVEARRKQLGDAITINSVGEGRKTAGMFVVKVADGDPKRARALNEAFLDAWFALSLPRPDEKAKLQTDLAEYERQFKSVNEMYDRMERDFPDLAYSVGSKGVVAYAGVELLRQKTTIYEKIVALKQRLKGSSRDVVVSAPTLPTVPTNTPRSILAATAWFVTTVLMALLALIVHFTGAASREDKSRMADIRAAIRPRWLGKKTKTDT